MIYSEVSSKSEIVRRRIMAGAVLAAVLGVSGCASYNPVTEFHHYEGGVIGSNPPPPPGLNEPPPNLASVPSRPKLVPPAQQHELLARLQAANSSQNTLPAPAGGVPKPAPTVVAAPHAPPPLLIGFRPGRAIVSHCGIIALKALAARRGGHAIAAIGFAPLQTSAGLRLALRRATAIANVLVAAGMPTTFIRIEALANGRGGAAQLIYTPPPAKKPISPNPATSNAPTPNPIHQDKS